ncbi:hypothetical protein JCM19300_3399 [Algibacter lectus]|uniref:Uncharacterized protein n=1 Tax=Algibacter lectus TaxID=221126 RepID=A0A090WTX1_9FLAO|nr:hypothetical protein JCM19300_3399 [Algibacter lectus]GAL79678.1 hypothetical protein JCM19274_3090 [Algibacter lectus]
MILNFKVICLFTSKLRLGWDDFKTVLQVPLFVLYLRL